MFMYRTFSAEAMRFMRLHGAFLILLLCSLALLGCQKNEASNTTAIKLEGAEFGGAFKLTGPDDKQVALSDFKGKAVLLFFGFVQCPDVCPTAMSRAAEAKRLLGKDGDRLQVIFVSLDPERDTPVILKEYAAAFGNDFLGLTSDVDTIRQTADAFKIFYAKVPTGSSYTMDHSAISYLYDPSGNIRSGILSSASAEEVASEVRRVLE